MDNTINKITAAPPKERFALVRELIDEQRPFYRRANISRRYYKNENDIVKDSKKRLDSFCERSSGNPLRVADNRIPHPFHRMLVEQKAAYLFAQKVLFRSGDPEKDEMLNRFSDSELSDALFSLCVDASNAGKAYVQTYLDREGSFRTAVIDPCQIVPFYSDDLRRRLVGVLRHYWTKAPDGKKVFYAELWDENGMNRFASEGGALYAVGEKIPHFRRASGGFSTGYLPFAEFKNTPDEQGDLWRIKELIDVYDKTVSLYANDVEDLQQLIFVLVNYGGQDLGEFLDDLRRYKAIKVDRSGIADGGVETLKVDIPVEARTKLLSVIEKNIWTLGQGVKLSEDISGNVSGVALKHLYGLLEIKASVTEREFRKGINRILELYSGVLRKTTGAGFDPGGVTPIFTRTMISNEKELTEICVMSKGIISDETICANHPWAEDTVRDAAKPADQTEKSGK